MFRYILLVLFVVSNVHAADKASENATAFILRSLRAVGTTNKLERCPNCNENSKQSAVNAFGAPTGQVWNFGNSSGGTANPQVFDDIKKIVDAHPNCLSADAGKGKKVGAVKGFVYGTAMAFARTMCRKDNDPVKQAIVKGGKADALQVYGGELGAGGAMQAPDGIGQASMNAGQFSQGAEAIRKTYVLLLGHAQWESSGNFTEGRDVNGQVQTPDGTEAGLWQISYDFRGRLDKTGQEALQSIQKAFQKEITPGSRGPTQALLQTSKGGAPRACMTEIFSEGIKQVKSDPYVGSGEAADFQRLNRECPAASAEINAFAIRHNVDHFGPLKRKEVVAPVQCEKMLEEVATKAQSACPSFEVQGSEVPMS